MVNDIQNCFLYLNSKVAVTKFLTRVGVGLQGKLKILWMYNENVSLRSVPEEVDEREIYRGSENRIAMFQTYTHQFQCLYDLHNYPFDGQVYILLQNPH